MFNKLLIGSISLFLFICSLFVAQIIVDRYYEPKPEIVLVQSDLFKDVSYIKLDELIKDDAVLPLFITEDKYDLSFKIALFYSDLSIVILKKSKDQQNLNKYVDDLYRKSVNKWDDLIIKDKSMLFFKNYYLQSYRNAAFNQTNSK